MKLVYLASHPIQYHAPLFRALAARCDFEVWYAHRQDAAGQAAAGYGVAFDWDVDLTTGFRHRYFDNVARRPGPGHFRGVDAPAVAASLAAEPPDVLVVGGWNLKAYWQAAHAARRAGTRVFARTDSRLLAGEARWRTWRRRLTHGLVLRAFDGFLAAGTPAAHYLRALGIPAPRIHLVPHTVDRRHFASGRAQRDALRSAHDAGARRVVLVVARLLAFKRVDRIIEALGLLPGGSHVLWVAGDGPLRGTLAALARRHGVECEWLGFVNQSRLPAVMAAADLLALASDARETWGMVANEALAAGTPVLVSVESGCATDLREFAPAVRVVEGGAEAWALALAEAIRADPGALRAGCEAAAAAYSPERAAAALLRAVDA